MDYKTISNKNSISRKSIIFIILGVSSISLFLRIYITPFEIPLSLDALEYYAFGYEIAISQNYPLGILETNDGWSIFLSPFFTIFHNTDFMTLNFVQRILSIIISTFTIIPIYYLCKEFVNKKFAVIGSILFVLDPRIINNSILGVTESIYIFLNVIILFSVFRKDPKFIFLTFLLIGFSSVVRYEGLLMLIPVSVIYFIRFGKSKKDIINFSIAIIILLLVLSPIAYLRTDANGMDGFTSHIFTGVGDYFSSSIIKNDEIESQTSSTGFLIQFSINSIVNSIKYLIWISIPMFVCFLPLGIYKIIRHRKKEIYYLIFLSIFMIIPALYAFGRDFQDPRYLLILIPTFSVISVYGLSQFDKFSQKTVLAVFVSIIILFAGLFLWYLQDDKYDLINERYQISKIVANTATGVNNYEDAYLLKAAELEQKWPTPLEKADSGELKGQIITDVKRIVYSDAINLIEYIKNSRDSGLSHLVVFENDKQEFLNDVFLNSEKYPYLQLEFDSKNNGFSNNILIYKIDYEIFNDIIE